VAVLLSVLFTLQSKVDGTLVDQEKRGQAGDMDSEPFLKFVPLLLFTTTRHRAKRTTRPGRIGHGSATDQMVNRTEEGERTLGC